MRGDVLPTRGEFCGEKRGELEQIQLGGALNGRFAAVYIQLAIDTLRMGANSA